MDRLHITRFCAGVSPSFVAEANGRQIAIHLDSSAILYLKGTATFEDRDVILRASIAKITQAAQRLLVADENLSAVTLSALDFDRDHHEKAN